MFIDCDLSEETKIINFNKFLIQKSSILLLISLLLSYVVYIQMASLFLPLHPPPLSMSDK